MNNYVISGAGRSAFHYEPQQMLFRATAYTVVFASAILLAACSKDDGNSKAANSKLEQAANAAHQQATSMAGKPRCRDYTPTKQAYFGDLHVHTSFSFDAHAYGVKTTPEDAYRFARGEAIPFLPLAEDGTMAGSIKIDRPLDFVAVTDHAEFLGEYQLCTDKDSASYNSDYCNTYRKGGVEAIMLTGTALATQPSTRLTPVCGEGARDCLAASVIPWQAIIAAAENANDDSPACEFTSFVGYEYSGAPGSSNYHRNVIFRNANVPEMPVSIFEAPRDYDLWLALNKTCSEKNNCEYLSIPHNSNLSNGHLLTPYANLEGTLENKIAYTKQRLAREPLVEMFQHKGSSECANGFAGILGAPDELCEMEQIREIGRPGATGTVLVEAGKVKVTNEVPNPTVFCEQGTRGFGGMQGNGCLHKNDFYRTALLTGLQEQNQIGMNPVKLGAIASTDTHMSTPGAAKESDWRGHIHAEWNKDGRLLSPVFIPSGKLGNPGGLVGVYAPENSRNALFDAMLNRETFGTSGPRIKPRLFASWRYPENLCDDPKMLEKAYARGVPMGGDLGAAPSKGSVPRLLVAALADPASDAAPLQKLQLIKGWIDAEGNAHNKVFDVAGDAENDAGVDRQTGKRYGRGHSNLCAVFEDPEFNAAETAYYYMRAVENPSPRWSLLDCISYGEAERPDVCDSPKISAVIQEQAWASPIWYTPATTQSPVPQ
ncbi:MAG: DUF3604 domain-containing protein [Pseudomonadales bacterium]|nr:DUF3604 domain-containing protein [Pseudomonadales bacterium]